MMADERDHWKKLAAESAVTQVASGMIVGLGTGTTGEFGFFTQPCRSTEGDINRV